MQHLVRADRARRPAATTSSTTPTGWASARRSRSTCRRPSRRSPTAAGRQPGGFSDDVELANAAYGQARDVRDAAPDGARRVDRRQRRRADAAAPRDGARPASSGTRDDRPASRWRRVISAARRRRRSHAAMVQAVEGDLGRQFTTGAKVPGVTDGRQVGHGRAGRHGRAALVVHRLRPGRGTRRSRSPSSSSRPAAAASVAAPIAGDLHAALLDLSSDIRERREPAAARPDEPAPPDRRAADSSASGWPRSPLVLAALFGGVAAAAWVGGEPFLGVMGAIGCLMTALGRGAHALSAARSGAGTARLTVAGADSPPPTIR